MSYLKCKRCVVFNDCKYLTIYDIKVCWATMVTS